MAWHGLWQYARTGADTFSLRIPTDRAAYDDAGRGPFSVRLPLPTNSIIGGVRGVALDGHLHIEWTLSPTREAENVGITHRPGPVSKSKPCVVRWQPDATDNGARGLLHVQLSCAPTSSL